MIGKNELKDLCGLVTVFSLFFVVRDLVIRRIIVVVIVVVVIAVVIIVLRLLPGNVDIQVTKRFDEGALKKCRGSKTLVMHTAKTQVRV